MKEEDNYKKFIDIINRFKSHPLLIGWYVNDEFKICLTNYTRNRTIKLHELVQIQH